MKKKSAEEIAAGAATDFLKSGHYANAIRMARQSRQKGFGDKILTAMINNQSDLYHSIREAYELGVTLETTEKAIFYCVKKGYIKTAANMLGHVGVSRNSIQAVFNASVTSNQKYIALQIAREQPQSLTMEQFDILMTPIHFDGVLLPRTSTKAKRALLLKLLAQNRPVKMVGIVGQYGKYAKNFSNELQQLIVQLNKINRTDLASKIEKLL